VIVIPFCVAAAVVGAASLISPDKTTWGREQAQWSSEHQAIRMTSKTVLVSINLEKE
jgi:hypothetical protein